MPEVARVTALRLEIVGPRIVSIIGRVDLVGDDTESHVADRLRALEAKLMQATSRSCRHRAEPVVARRAVTGGVTDTARPRTALWSTSPCSRMPPSSLAQAPISPPLPRAGSAVEGDARLGWSRATPPSWRRSPAT